MRVLLAFNHSRVVGGGEIYFSELIKSLLTKQKISVAVFIPGEGEIRKELSEKGAEKIFISNMPSLKNFSQFIKSIRELREMLKNFSPDIIHVNGSRAMMYFSILKAMNTKNSKFKLVWHVRISKKDYPDPFLFLLSDGIIANSFKTLKERFGYLLKIFPRKKIKVIYNGIDLSIRDRVKEKIENGTRERIKKFFSLKEIVISSYGRLEEGKGFDLLLLACERLKDTSNFSLLIAGYGPMKDKLEKYAKRTHLVLPGYMKVEDILAISDVVVFPSLIDSFGNVVLEAMACGIPQIVSRFSGASEIVENMKSALVVNPKNIKELSLSINTLIKDKELRKKLSEDSLKKSEEFSIENHREKVINFYEEVLR